MNEKSKGHGHVIPNEDGSKARCGGPGLCRECAGELIDSWRKQKLLMVNAPPREPSVDDLILEIREKLEKVAKRFLETDDIKALQLTIAASDSLQIIQKVRADYIAQLVN